MIVWITHKAHGITAPQRREPSRWKNKTDFLKFLPPFFWMYFD